MLMAIIIDNPHIGAYNPHIGVLRMLVQITAIGDALFTKTQKKVLGLLYGKPDERFYTNEIMRWASMGRGTVSRELDRLVGAGLLKVVREGNQNYFQANEHNPIFDELKGIVRKTFGVADMISESLKPLDEDIEVAFIYGSIAKNTDTKVSDIDLMLVGHDLQYGKIMEVLVSVEEVLQRSINPTIYTVDAYAEKLKEGNSFITRVMEQPKIMIKGVINDFGKLAEN